MAEQPLSDHVRAAVLDTADADEAWDHVETLYGYRVLGTRPTDRPGRVLLSAYSCASATSGQAHAPGEVAYRVSNDDSIVFNTLHAGSVDLGLDGGTHRFAAGDSFIANNGPTELTSTTRDIRVLNTVLSTRLLSAVAHPDDGDEAIPVTFGSLRARPQAAGRWRAATRYLHDVLSDPDAASMPLLFEAAARQVAATALVTFDNDAVSAPPVAASTDATSDTVRRACAFIDAHPDLDLTIGDIARASHVSARAVQLAFRRHLDTTPLAYLRRVRLDQAHADLLGAVPGDGTTVGSVAARWGFFGPGRFAEQYRTVFGRLPSETLGGAESA